MPYSMENQPDIKPRPTFLTVLCIISFVGLGLSVINNFSTLIITSTGTWLYDMIQDSLEMALQQASVSDPGTSLLLEHIFDAVLKLIDVLPLLAGISLVCALIALAGVLFMWNQKRTGFYLYTGAKVVLVFLPILLIGYNFLSVIIALTTFFGTAVFVTLYGLNLKSMK
jgi:hypothetical protein